ncbi:MAG: Arm DNA-binding domain-containing protein, partial [Pseudomonadota bacterium]
MKLSEFAIRKAKSREKSYRMSDGDNLYLLIQPSGSKLWQFRYRFMGKENVLSFGKYPLVTLAEARTKRGMAQKSLLDGVDPAAQRKADRLDAENEARQTFGTIADEHLQRLELTGSAPATIKKNRWLLKDLAKPLENRPIKQITPHEILDILRKVEASGRRDTARRLRGVISSVF